MADRYEPGEREWAVGEAARLNQQSLARFDAQWNQLMNDDNVNSGTVNNQSATSYPVVFSNTTPEGSLGVSTSLAGQKISNTKQVDMNFPGARKDNPLSRLSSYTYCISLYMVSPEAMNAFIQNDGRLDRSFIQTGVFVVAQSGGINNSSEMRAITNSGRVGMGQEGLDFYIDDFSVNTFLPGNPSNQSSLNSEINFKIIEPVGFSFLTNLNKASAAINNYSSLIKNSKTVTPNNVQQNYIIGVKFYGYHADGSLVKSSDVEFANYNNGFSDSNSVIERYIPIRLASISFRLDNNVTVYNCSAYQHNELVATGTNNGTIQKTIKIVAGTVGEALRGELGQQPTNDSSGLAQNLNQYYRDLQDRNAVTIPTSYDIEFLDNGAIENASLIVNDKDTSAKTAPMSSAQNTQNVTIKESINATTINKTKKNITFKEGTSIVQMIDTIITNSSYVSDALKQTNTQRPEPTTTDAPTKTTLRWYSVNPIVQIAGRDPLTQNWAYKIKYQIRPYDIPYLRSTYQAKTSKYPGPFKFYNYWYTGENSEVLSYEQEYNNLYYVPNQVSTSVESAQPSTVNATNVPIAPKMVSQGTQVGGDQNQGSQINQSVRAQLYSPGDQVVAKIKILGDPDYLMTGPAVDRPKSSSMDPSKYYGSDLSINPLNGQVFIQIVFNIAEDYQNNGLLDVSDAVQFYETDAVVKAGIKGLVYKVIQVTSTFSKGMFTQTLDLILVPAGQLVDVQTQTPNYNQREGQISQNQQAGITTSGDTRNPTIQQFEDGSSIQTFDDGSTLVTDVDGKFKAVEAMNSTPPSPDDDTKSIPAPQTVQQAEQVYGRESTAVFGTTGGGAALLPVRSRSTRRVR